MTGGARPDSFGHFVTAVYRVVDLPSRLEARAQSIAVGLTIGSWTDVPASRKASVQAHCGQVERVDVVAETQFDEVVAELTISYPTVNFTATVTSILTTVFGKLSMDGEIRLIELRIPDDFKQSFPGPEYGTTGIRERLAVWNRPLLMSIFKACVGLNLEELTEHYRSQALGGADFIKDDEIFFSEAYATPEQRVEAFVVAARQVYEEVGHSSYYAVNLTGPVHALRDRARRLSELGAGALLVNAIAYGYDVLRDLAADPEISAPLMIHPAMSGALYGSATHGIAADIVLGQLLRMTGADIVIYPSPYGSVTLERSEGLKLAASLRQPGVHRAVLPAPSAGIYPGLVPQLIADLGVDCIVNAGGAIHGHPGGATAGARAFRAAIAATVAGNSLADAAAEQADLAAALNKWGSGR